MDSGPSVRVAWCQLVLKSTKAQDPDLFARLRESVDPDAIDLIESSAAISWIPMSNLLLLLDFLHESLGPDAFVEHYRKAALHSFKGRFLSTLVGAGVRLFGRRAMIRVFPRGWSTTVRGCGIPAVEQSNDTNRSDVRFTNVPADLVQNEAYVISIVAVLYAVLEVGGFQGSAVFCPERSSASELSYTVTSG